MKITNQQLFTVPFSHKNLWNFPINLWDFSEVTNKILREFDIAIQSRRERCFSENVKKFFTDLWVMITWMA